MRYICVKWLTYLRNGYNMWEMMQICAEMDQICGKCLKYLINGLNMCELTYRFGKWLKHFGNG